MKTIHFSLLRSLFSILIGLLLVMWPELIIENLIMIVGMLFLFPSLYSLLSRLKAYRQKKALSLLFPFESVGAGLLGLWMMVCPSFFVNGIMYVLGFILLLGATFQLSMLCKAKKACAVSWWVFLTPSLVFLIGLYILLNPSDVLANIIIVFGAACLIYGCMELVYSFLVYSRIDKAEVVESTIQSAEPTTTEKPVIIEEKPDE